MKIGQNKSSSVKFGHRYVVHQQNTYIYLFKLKVSISDMTRPAWNDFEEPIFQKLCIAYWILAPQLLEFALRSTEIDIPSLECILECPCEIQSIDDQGGYGI